MPNVDQVRWGQRLTVGFGSLKLFGALGNVVISASVFKRESGEREETLGIQPAPRRGLL